MDLEDLDENQPADIESLQAQAQDAQANADRYQPSVYIVCLMVVVTKDVFDWIGISLFGAFLAFLVWMVEIYLALQRFGNLSLFDIMILLLTGGLEALPLGDLAPASTLMVLYMWNEARNSAIQYQEQADMLNEQIAQLSSQERIQAPNIENEDDDEEFEE